MVIAIDPGDIRKKACIQDGVPLQDPRRSEHEIGEGYWLAKAVAADIEHKKVIPLYLEAYSQEAQEFKSENDQLFKVIDVVAPISATKGFMRSTVEETGGSSTTSFSRRGRRSGL